MFSIIFSSCKVFLIGDRDDKTISEGADPGIFSAGVSTYGGLFGIAHNITGKKYQVIPHP